MIRLAVPSIDREDVDAVTAVLKSGFLVQGPKVAAFEAEVAEYVGVEHAVAVANCTAALHLALLALDVRAGDKVAVTAYSWPATANVIALCGAEPVFVDVDPETFNMDPACLADVLARTRVKAILPVHAFGGMADMVALEAAAREHGTSIVEDAACALGSALHGRRAGAWGTMACFSFHPRKAITTGEGGMITTNDRLLTQRLRSLRNHGQDPEAPLPDFVMPGYNLRLTEFQAALGSSQMAKVERLVAIRRTKAEAYDRLFRGTVVTPPVVLADSVHVYQSYVVLLPREAAPIRKELIARLKERGIETTIGTYHMPRTRYFASAGGFGPGDFPVTDDVAERALSLPLHADLSAADQERVSASLFAVLAELDRSVAAR